MAHYTHGMYGKTFYFTQFGDAKSILIVLPIEASGCQCKAIK